MTHNYGLITWEIMQGIKQDSTLRVGPKGDKPPPRIVDRCGKQDGQINRFLEWRKRILMMHRRINGNGA